MLSRDAEQAEQHRPRLCRQRSPHSWPAGWIAPSRLCKQAVQGMQCRAACRRWRACLAQQAMWLRASGAASSRTRPAFLQVLQPSASTTLFRHAAFGSSTAHCVAIAYAGPTLQPSSLLRSARRARVRAAARPAGLPGGDGRAPRRRGRAGAGRRARGARVGPGPCPGGASRPGRRLCQGAAGPCTACPAPPPSVRPACPSASLGDPHAALGRRPAQQSFCLFRAQACLPVQSRLGTTLARGRWQEATPGRRRSAGPASLPPCSRRARLSAGGARAGGHRLLPRQQPGGRGAAGQRRAHLAAPAPAR
jgi:hypothetical protein